MIATASPLADAWAVALACACRRYAVEPEELAALLDLPPDVLALAAARGLPDPAARSLLITLVHAAVESALGDPVPDTLRIDHLVEGD